MLTSDRVKSALIIADGQVTRAGHILGVSKSTVYRAMDRHDLWSWRCGISNALKAAKADQLQAALDKAGGVTAAAAKILGVTPNTVTRWKREQRAEAGRV